MKHSLIITSEHAGNYVPEEYAHIFKDRREVLDSHQGWDPGAWDIAKYLAEQMKAPVFGCFTTRLLVEANRSLHNPELFSAFTSKLNEDEKSKLLNNIYFPYRTEVMDTLKTMTKPILHLSVHSFTPVLKGNIRKVDIGILFDPERSSEGNFSLSWKKTLEQQNPELTVKLNAPYQGIDDGFPTYLRAQFTDHQYLGIELEVNQKFVGTDAWPVIKKTLFESIVSIL